MSSVSFNIKITIEVEPPVEEKKNVQTEVVDVKPPLTGMKQ